MSDEDLLRLLQQFKDTCDKKAEALTTLKAYGIDVEADDGATIDDMIQREYDASQRLERTMEPIRTRIALRTAG